MTLKSSLPPLPSLVASKLPISTFFNSFVPVLNPPPPIVTVEPFLIEPTDLVATVGTVLSISKFEKGTLALPALS